MENQIGIFNYLNRNVRVVMKGGEPWFVAADVCEALGVKDTWGAIQRLSDFMKGTDSISTLGGPQQMTVLSAPGVYRLAFTGRKKEADDFANWVATEVLPSIQKYGIYATPQARQQLLNNPRFAAEMFTKMAEDEERLAESERMIASQKQMITTQKKAIVEMTPMARYCKEVLMPPDGEELFTTTTLAEGVGMTAQDLNIFLSRKNVMRKYGQHWTLIGEYARKGYTTRPTIKVQKSDAVGDHYFESVLHWTTNGRYIVWRLLCDNTPLTQCTIPRSSQEQARRKLQNAGIMV